MDPDAGMAKTALKAAAVAVGVGTPRRAVALLGVATAVAVADADVGVETSAEQPRETARRQARIGSRRFVTPTVDSQTCKYSQVPYSLTEFPSSAANRRHDSALTR